MTECTHLNTEVTDSRLTTSRAFKDFKDFIGVIPECIRRRRKCLDCGEIFTTYEVPKDVLEQLVDHRTNSIDSERNRQYKLVLDFVSWAQSLPPVTLDKRQEVCYNESMGGNEATH